MNITSSQSSIVGSLFVIIKVVIFFIAELSSFLISSSVEASTADNASSKIKILGFLNIALAKAILCL